MCWRTKRLRVCERDAAPSGEAPRQPQVLELPPPTSGRYMPPHGRVLSTTAARSGASFLGRQVDWTVLVRSDNHRGCRRCVGARSMVRAHAVGELPLIRELRNIGPPFGASRG
jgi:hypothetical protein